MEDIQPDLVKVKDSSKDANVDSLTREMNRTFVSKSKKVSFMGPLRPKFKHTSTVSDKKSQKIRRLILLHIIDGYPCATIISTSQNLEALDLKY